MPFPASFPHLHASLKFFRFPKKQIQHMDEAWLAYLENLKPANSSVSAADSMDLVASQRRQQPLAAGGSADAESGHHLALAERTLVGARWGRGMSELGKS